VGRQHWAVSTGQSALGSQHWAGSLSRLSPHYPLRTMLAKFNSYKQIG